VTRKELLFFEGIAIVFELQPRFGGIEMLNIGEGMVARWNAGGMSANLRTKPKGSDSLIVNERNSHDRFP